MPCLALTTECKLLARDYSHHANENSISLRKPVVSDQTFSSPRQRLALRDYVHVPVYGLFHEQL